MTRILMLAAAVTLAACGGDKGDSGDTSATSATNTTGTAGTAGATATVGEKSWNLSGMAVNLADFGASQAAEGLCATLADPTPIVAGDELEVISTGVVGADGSFSFADIVTTSTIGLMVVISDCADEGTVAPTATGITYDSYNALEEGGTLSDFVAFSLDNTAGLPGWQAGLEAQGYAGDLAVDGTLVAFVQDAAGAPVEGATIVGPPEVTPYYFTGADFSGAATSAAAGSMALLPGGPIFAYECFADGYTFEPYLTGSLPGYIVLGRFVAN